jgi:hypothetical protein
MNSRRITLLLVAVNLGLIGAVAYMVLALRSSPTSMTGTVRTELVTSTVTQIAVRKINATNNLLAALAGRPLNWRALESTNYVQYIENLRGFGCPEETIRDIIITDVAKLYARRRAELRAQLQPRQYWQPSDPLGGLAGSRQLRQLLRALDKEQRALIRDLLGVDLRTEMARYSGDGKEGERDYGFLPPDKQDRVRLLAEQFAEMEEDVHARTGGLLLDEDVEELKDIQRQHRAELAAALAPEELEEYELRHSGTADNLRATLGGFEPTEEEFRKMFRLQRTFDLEFERGFDERNDADQVVKALAQPDAQTALNEEMRKLLGPQRFAEYQRAQDGDYQALVQLSERLEMPLDLANRVYNMKQAAEAYKFRAESSPNLTDEQRAQAVAALARETERSVAGVLGETAFRAYQQHGGDWLSNLRVIDESAVPPPPPQPEGILVPYDLNLLPPELRDHLLNSLLFPRPPR